MNTIENNTLTSNVAIEMATEVGTTTVVQNDTTSRPSIKVGSLNAPVSIKVADADADAGTASKLAVMEQARISWETTELAASNKRLYSILRDAYSYYLVMKQDSVKETRVQYAADLENFIQQRGYTFMPTTHDMTRVVKCVFGVDRRRVSAYSIALREALRQQVAAADLVSFIDENGGVEQIRLGGSKPLSVTKRAAKAVDEVLGTDLGMLKFDPKLFAADADWADKQVVIVATYLPTGEFQANAVIRHDSAVNAALAAIYSQRQAKAREAAKAERDAEEAAVKAAKAADKAAKDAGKEHEKQAKAEQKLAADAAEKVAAEQQAALIAHAATLFEGLEG